MRKPLITHESRTSGWNPPCIQPVSAARRRGRRGGRPAAIDAEKLMAITAALDGGATKAAVCRTFGIKRSTLVDCLGRIGWSAGNKAREA